MGPIAQDTLNPLLVAAVFTVVSLPIGLLIGYALAYRYKRRYLRAAKDLANLKGESFRGGLTKMGFPQGTAARSVPLPNGADKLARALEVEQELRQQLAERTAERDQLVIELDSVREQAAQLQQQLDDASTALEAEHAVDRGGNGRAAVAGGSTTATSGTEAWQLAQLHREQVVMQLRLDEYLQQIHQLTQQRDQWQRQADNGSQEFQQLRQLLAEQEAVIASVERHRDSLATRVSELEQR